MTIIDSQRPLGQCRRRPSHAAKKSRRPLKSLRPEPVAPVIRQLPNDQLPVYNTAMRHYLLITSAILLLAGGAWADELTVNGRTRTKIRVINYAKGKLTYRVGGKYLKADLVKITRLQLDGENLLNKAEDLLAAGELRQSVATYEAALRKTRGQWHIALVKARLEQAKRLVPDDPPAEPASTPATSKPAASGPAASKPAASQPVEPPDPPAGLDDLGADLATEPEDPSKNAKWENLDKHDRKDAMDEYKRSLPLWQASHNFRNVKVAWSVTLKEITANGDGYLVTATSSRDFVVTAMVGDLEASLAKALKEGQSIVLSGTIHDYKVQVNRTEGLFEMEMVQLGVALKDATLTVAEE